MKRTQSHFVILTVQRKINHIGSDFHSTNNRGHLLPVFMEEEEIKRDFNSNKTNLPELDDDQTVTGPIK